jgi:hypothetical protein
MSYGVLCWILTRSRTMCLYLSLEGPWCEKVQLVSGTQAE